MLQEMTDTGNQDEEVIILKGQHTSGAEHNVWLNRTTGVVHKIPSPFGQFWQKMHPDYAKRDLNAMKETGVPIVPTELYPNAEVIYVGKTREHVSYVLKQPLYESSHPLTFSDLFHNWKYRQYLLDIMRMGNEIRKKYNLGLDLVGGKAAKLLYPTLDPRRKTMPVEINNLLVADDTIVTTQDWPGCGVTKDEPIAQKGEVRMCDSRMYDFDRQGPKGDGIKTILLAVQDAQDCANWSILKYFGLKAEFDFEKNHIRRMIRYIMSLALPKMQAYAEAMR